MPLIVSIVVFIIISVIALFAFFADHKKGQKFSNVQKLVLFLTIVLVGIGTWDIINRDFASKTDKKDVIDTVGAKAKSVNLHTDTVGAAIRRGIDSARTVITDSMKNVNDRTVTILQKTIRQQSHELDSLGRLHAERHLTEADKKDIIRRIKKIQKDNSITDTKGVNILMSQNSNGSKFASELFDFLQSKGYTVNSGQGVGGNTKEYEVIFVPSFRAPEIVVGSFRL